MFVAVMPSIIKNLADHERMTVNMSYSLDNMDMLCRLAQFQPSGFEVSQNTTKHLQDLHVDIDKDGKFTLYDCPSKSMTELRGPTRRIHVLKKDWCRLLDTAMRDVNKESLLGTIHGDYKMMGRKARNGLCFGDYLAKLFRTPKRVANVRDKIEKYHQTEDELTLMRADLEELFEHFASDAHELGGTKSESRYKSGME